MAWTGSQYQRNQPAKTKSLNWYHKKACSIWAGFVTHEISTTGQPNFSNLIVNLDKAWSEQEQYCVADICTHEVGFIQVWQVTLLVTNATRHNVVGVLPVLLPTHATTPWLHLHKKRLQLNPAVFRWIFPYWRIIYPRIEFARKFDTSDVQL